MQILHPHANVVWEWDTKGKVNIWADHRELYNFLKTKICERRSLPALVDFVSGARARARQIFLERRSRSHFCERRSQWAALFNTLRFFTSGKVFNLESDK